MQIAKNAKIKNNRQISSRNETLQCYLLILLPLIGFVVFTVYPILWTFKWSLFNYNGIPSSTKFIGFDNFITFFTKDFSYWKSWFTTLQFAVLKMPIELSLAMLLAVLLNQRYKGHNFFRVMYYLPNVISVAIIGLVFSNMFGFFGIINNILLKLGIITSEIDFFETKKGAMTVMVIASIWNTFGVNVMYFLAAMTNIPTDVYESAALDGAGKFTVFFKITLPMIAPTLQTILLLSIVGTLGTNDFVLVLTGGGPGGQTFTVMSYLTKQFLPGFTESAQPALGYGCSMSVVTTIMMTVIALGYNKISQKMKNVF